MHDVYGILHKTTLAKQVFNVKEILLSLLQSIIQIDDKVHRRDEAELADLLQKNLKRKRYLIVMDDIWSYKAWDDMRQCFPIDNNGSRILLTTCHTEVALYASSNNLLLKMNLMKSDESWNLLRERRLQMKYSRVTNVTLLIANKCQGLPLTNVMVAGLLSKSKRTKEEWKNVAENV
ncbi:hypothetical protein P3L10_025257 [Capsicum annuum]